MILHTSRSIHTDNNHIFVHKTITQKTKKNEKKKISTILASNQSVTAGHGLVWRP